ncbi:DUF3828 domain-containing protein [Enterobacter cloacae]|uniref:DUF3828 domain-containing protein n=1 Tax=Enterobacter cloacae TaxID=550 RepID=UPI00200F91E0|nr:DUF3828 domain-containing protein [Enterobacter cloacae]MCM7171043.1 YbjP/YqhG family protein [Enterobacter cloacae]UPW30046.1 YbjP/YqhG family protein [Enterobacter cloacae]
MKLSINNLFYVFIYAFLFTCSRIAFAAEPTNPEDIVHDFYSEYLKDYSKNNDALIKNYVSDQLMDSIADSTMCNYDSDDSISASELEKKCSQKHECKQYKGNYVCDWYGVWIESDVNYFTKSQDIYPSWKLNIKTNTITDNGSKSVVGVVLGDDSESKNTLRVSLKKINTSWKIISVTE